MNKIMYTIILASILLSANSCTPDKKTDVSSQNYLTRSEWGPEIGHLGLYFVFAPNNTFKTDANFEGGAYYSGTYEFKDNKLKLKIGNPGEWPELKDKELTYRLKQSDTSIFFTECLELENGDSVKDINLKKMWSQSKIVAKDQKRSYQNVAVQTINNFAGIKDDTNYYQSPSENSKRFMFSIHDDKNDKLGNWTLVVPVEVHQGRIQLILRTVQRDDKNRYWYLIILPVGNGRYDLIKTEGSSENWYGPSVGWIKETDIKKIEAK